MAAPSSKASAVEDSKRHVNTAASLRKVPLGTGPPPPIPPRPRAGTGLGVSRATKAPVSLLNVPSGRIDTNVSALATPMDTQRTATLLATSPVLAANDVKSVPPPSMGGSPIGGGLDVLFPSPVPSPSSTAPSATAMVTAHSDLKSAASAPASPAVTLSYLIIAARSQDAPAAATQASLLQHFLSDGVQARGDSLVGETLTGARVTAELRRLFGSAAAGQGIVVAYSGHCNAAGAFALQSKGGAAESVTPVQLLKAWSGSSSFKAGGSLFLLLNCCHSGVWAAAARDRKAERVWVQCSSPADLTTFDGAFPALWIEFAVGRINASSLRGRLPASPAAYAPARESCVVLVSADDLKGTPLSSLIAERPGTVPARAAQSRAPVRC
jgi:hypothetical protein